MKTSVEYRVPQAVLNIAYGNNGDYGSMPCRDEVYRIPDDWLEANARRFHFTDDQIINAAVAEFEAPNLPTCARCYGIYFLIEDKRIIYVGQSTSIDNRIHRHRKNGVCFDSFTWFEAPELYLKTIEAYYIRRIDPPLNNDFPLYNKFAKHMEAIDGVSVRAESEWVIVVTPPSVSCPWK